MFGMRHFQSHGEERWAAGRGWRRRMAATAGADDTGLAAATWCAPAACWRRATCG